MLQSKINTNYINSIIIYTYKQSINQWNVLEAEGDYSNRLVIYNYFLKNIN